MLSAAEPLLQSFMKLNDRGGSSRQADIEQGLLFAIRAHESEERWRTQGHDMSDLSHKIRVMLSHLRQKKGFKATANTCKTSVERASRRCLMFIMVIIILNKKFVFLLPV